MPDADAHQLLDHALVAGTFLSQDAGEGHHVREAFLREKRLPVASPVLGLRFHRTRFG
jgi:hypothetical protein